MALDETSSSFQENVGASLERVDSEYECDLMIEALSRELNVVRDHLAFLTHHLHTSTHSQGKSPSCSPLHTSSLRKSITPEQKHQKKGTKNVNVQPSASPDLTEEEVTRKQHHYLGVVDKMEGERASMRRKCLLLMQVHIEEQLCRVRRRGEALRRRMVRRENRIRAAKLKLKPPRFRSSGVDDTSFLGNVYISTFYQIIDQEHKLRKSGHLKSLSELKQFWDSMLSPLIKEKAISPSPQPRLLQSAYSDEDMEYADTWALTAVPPEQIRKTPVMTFTPPSTFGEDDLKFIPSTLPKIKSISDILDEGKQMTKEFSEREHRSYELVSERKQLHRMYQQARANEMAMRRLLPESPTFDLSPLPISHPRMTLTSQLTLEDGSTPTSDSEHTPLISVPEDIGTVIERTSREEQTKLLPLRTKFETHKTFTQSLEAGTSSVSSLRLTPSRPIQREAVTVTLPPVVIPLTMDTALQEGQVIESKCKSALWTNYVSVQI